jgi:hypothetical protein
MSEIGFYRIKVDADTEKDVNLYINNILSSTKHVVPIEYCSDDLILKYLDRDGHYRFWVFNRFFEKRDQPEKVGSVNKFITNLLTDQSESSNVGYRNKRVIDATSDVPKEAIDVVSDIYASPRVYLYIGTSTDLASDWLEVEVSGNNIVKSRKGSLTRVDLSITLPEWYVVRMI